MLKNVYDVDCGKTVSISSRFNKSLLSSRSQTIYCHMSIENVNLSKNICRSYAEPGPFQTQHIVPPWNTNDKDVYFKPRAVWTNYCALHWFYWACKVLCWQLYFNEEKYQRRNMLKHKHKNRWFSLLLTLLLFCYMQWNKAREWYEVKKPTWHEVYLFFSE